MSIYAERAAAPQPKAGSPGPVRQQPRPAPPARQNLAQVLQLRAARERARAARPDGLPAQLKAGVEQLSGIAMDDVRVHRNSAKPARLGALAFVQGSDIHLGPGQERHLPHEAWHVVQQKQKRVKATQPLAFGGVNDDPVLEREATEIGARAERLGATAEPRDDALRHVAAPAAAPSQLKPDNIDKYYDLPLGLDGKYAGEKGKRRGKQAVMLNRLATAKAITVPGNAFVGGHLLKAEYGGKDVASNVVGWSPAMEITYTGYEARMPARMQARAQAWALDQRPADQKGPLTIRFHAQATFVDWARADVDIENPARSDAQIAEILKVLSKIPVNVAADLDGGQVADAWTIGAIAGGRIKITREPPAAPVQAPAGAQAAAPVVVPAVAADPPSWREEHISPE